MAASDGSYAEYMPNQDYITTLRVPSIHSKCTSVVQLNLLPVELEIYVPFVLKLFADHTHSRQSGLTRWGSPPGTCSLRSPGRSSHSDLVVETAQCTV